MRISPCLYPCCSVLATRFSNLTKFDCSHRRAAITYTQDIFHNECKRPHHATWKISNQYNENKYHHLTLENKFRLLLNKGVHMLYPHETIWMPLAWTNGEFWQISLADFRLCSAGVNWTNELGQSATFGGLPLTTQYQQHPLFIPEATSRQNFTPWWRILSVYHWWLNESCSWISKVIGS